MERKGAKHAEVEKQSQGQRPVAERHKQHAVKENQRKTQRTASDEKAGAHRLHKKQLGIAKDGGEEQSGQQPKQD
eukprot:3844288-Pleurochrysis_carterae.AAC.1